MFSRVIKYIFRNILIFIIAFAVVFLYNMKINSDYDDVCINVSESDLLVAERHHKLNSSDIFNFIRLVNTEKVIRNSESFGLIKEDTIVLVILLDKLSCGFKFVISSLSQITGIEEVLVIFSHTYFDENINKVIKSIDFCRVLQIYYPYSIQTHPDEFPGFDPNDCPYESSKYSRRNCTDSLFLDVRGRFRNPTGSERKHHWWWTANTIFETLSKTAKHTGLVIFSDDNFVFMNDFIYMASYMKNVASSLPQCEFLSLGSDIIPRKPRFATSDIYSVKLSSWNLKEHSRLLAFDISVWNSIIAHYDMFCTLDDASWLRSLYFISVHRRDGKSFKALSAVTPRAFKIDSCSTVGFFGSQCDLSKNVLTVASIEKRNVDEWFPSHLELFINVELEEDDIIFDYSEGNGGWADPRDWKLCRNMTAGKIKKILMEMNKEFHKYFGRKS